MEVEHPAEPPQQAVAVAAEGDENEQQQQGAEVDQQAPVQASARASRTRVYKALGLLRQLAELSARVEAVVFEVSELAAMGSRGQHRSACSSSSTTRSLFSR